VEIGVRERRARSSFNFERSDAWQKAIEHADFVYKPTKDFPIASGSVYQPAATFRSIDLRKSCGGFVAFLQSGHGKVHEIAYGSLLESVTNSEIAKRQQFVNPASCAEAYKQSELRSGSRRTTALVLWCSAILWLLKKIPYLGLSASTVTGWRRRTTDRVKVAVTSPKTSRVYCLANCSRCGTRLSR
jgi:hypothetical protein